ncbi:right-handed parallel beta-helix repeat-containing protein [Glycomyces paridis]|uniref:Right handed beta helix domain-containing protein n=1 Tax=Glycomyces paridis TaxID=2126555 RepID=A0A4S8PHA7_9ACTN|nr:right-handed parallel beta-helix repeat-containing protein [Glycomyces paridis]THV29987.1 hypothetical protein E9998_06280 [Glycomyces paridis]
MPHTPRPERRLPAAALLLGVLAVLGFTCYVGGITANSRVEGLPATDAFPALPDAEPPAYREDGPELLVCTDDAEDFAERNEGVQYNDRIANERDYEDCLADGFRDLAAAVAAAEPGTNIQVLPGRYAVEEAVLVETDGLQIEGLGDTPDDVQITANFGADTVLTAYAVEGLYVKGLTFGQARSAAVRLVGVRGAALDAVSAFQSDDTGILVEDSVGVLLTGCRAEAADNAGIRIAYAQADVTGCESTANTAGLEITGDNVNTAATANRLYGNATGLVVTDAGPQSDVTVAENLVYDNNTDDYDRAGTAACDTGADRPESHLCPDRTYPVGVGVLIADTDGVSVTANRIWNQEFTAVAAWGTPGPEGDGNRNTVADNTFGVRDDGRRERNRLDLWWDGVGTGNCFDEPGMHRSSPAALPGCDAVPESSRLLADPLRTLKTWQCGLDGTAADLPAGCDWFGARFTDRLEFQAAAVFAAALLFLTGAGWLAAVRAPDPPLAGQMTFSAIGTGAGGLLLLLAVWSGRADYEALAIGLWGIGWLLAGRSWFRCGMRTLGFLTGVIGLLAVLDGVDRGLWTVTPTPVSPSWLWLVLLPLWTLIALASAFGPRRREEEPSPIERTPVTAPSHDRWDW